MLNELAQEKLELYGGLDNVEWPDKAYIEKWRGKLPNSLLNFWGLKGIGSMAQGSLWLCRPEDYSEVLAVLFGADLNFSAKDCHVVGYSAFGELYVWSEHCDGVVIDLTQLWVLANKLTDPNYRSYPDRGVWSMMVAGSPDNLCDFLDDKGQQLYKRAVKKLGALERGECFGFFPARKLGGAPKLENLQRVKALEHFSILAQLDTPVLMDFNPWPPKIVRAIG